MIRLILGTIGCVALSINALGASITHKKVGDASDLSMLTITTDVMRATFNDPTGNFLNYHVIGTCGWWNSGIPPYMSITLKVNEFVPSAVVSVYNKLGSNPFSIVNKLYDPLLSKAGETTARTMSGHKISTSRYSGSNAGSSMQMFKQVDIIGDPALVFFQNYFFLPLIPPMTQPMHPYYSSLLDTYMWHTPYLDDVTHPQGLIPGVDDEGSLIDEWGGMYPRIGYITQPIDYKGSAVLALRALNITNSDVPEHIYWPMHTGGGACGPDCKVWPFEQNDFSNIKFQELYPIETDSANKSFGTDHLANLKYGYSQLKAGGGNYVWVMWQHYRGCINDPGGSLMWG